MSEKIIERLESEGGSRELDAEIAVLLDGFHELPPRYEGDEIGYGYIDADGAEIRPGHGGKQLVNPYTTSLDAALALAERCCVPWTEALGCALAKSPSKERLAAAICAEILRLKE